MNKYIEQLLTLYKEKKIPQETVISLLETYKAHHRKENNEPIAIIGLSCRMPMASTPDEFWQILKNGKNCITNFPNTRKDDTDSLIPFLANNLHSQTHPYWQGGFLSEVDKFDNNFFNILPAEAKIMDPQQRIFLELAHAALEDAGLPPSKIRGSNTGVFVGDVVNEYRKIISEVSPFAVIGNVTPFIASRISFFYNLHGPTINVSTTCSTSLVAVHLACQSLKAYECDLAIVGAVNLRLFPFALKDDPVDALGITTDKGACFAFDDRACGIVRGEGAGIIILKRLSDAEKDKHSIYAMIKGSSVNNDGRSSNVGAPNPLAQADLLKTAWKRSQIDPSQIDYIEAHGTGTRIGDPIEVQGVSKALSEFTPKKQFCGIGSIKTNIGHLTGGASGIAGLIKTVLSLKNELIPPSLHFEVPNEFINFPETPLYVVDRLTPWLKGTKPRIAGVSAFGFNGTNCHIVLEEGHKQEIQHNQFISRPLLFTFTHKSRSGLKTQLFKYLDFFLANKNHLRIEDISYTLSFGREKYPVAVSWEASSLEELITKIRCFLSNETLQKLDQEYSVQDTFVGLNPCLIHLPTYVFEPHRFWVDSLSWKNDERIINNIEFTQSENRVFSLDLPLLHIFKEVMGMENIQMNDNFFDLGGDSLIGIEIINQIHKKLNKKLSYNDLFQNPCISDLAKILDNKESSYFQDISLAPFSEFYPLSYGQRRLWVLHQMQENPVAYNIYDVYRFDSSIDVEKFQKTLDQLVLRHAAFRTCFVEQNGEPYQKIASQQKYDLTFLKVSSYLEVIEKCHEWRNHIFDLEKGPLSKALLLQLDTNTFFFFFMMHHIISDGWSIRIIIEELLNLYTDSSALKQLRIDTIDYCHWQRNFFSESNFKESEKFWLEKLEKAPICEIHGDKARPSLFNFKGARKKFYISEQLQNSIIQITNKENVTLFMFFLASVYVLIHKYTQQTDLVIGSPVAGRAHADLKPLVGFFVNTLALRTILDPLENFVHFLNTVRNLTLESLEHQNYPFDLLIDKLALSRDTSHSPLFNINVAFQNFELEEGAKKTLKQLNAKRIELEYSSCKWDIEFEFMKEHDGTLACYVEYYTELYSETMISELIATYQALLESLVINYEKPIYQLSLVKETTAVKGKEVSYPPLTLHQLFEDQVKRSSQLAAVKVGQVVLTYQELNEKANQLAHFLKFKLSIENEEPVGLYLENSQESIIAILAILKAGGCYVPLDVKAPLVRIKYLIQDAKIRHVISVKKHLRNLNDLLWSIPLSSFTCLDSHFIEGELEVFGSNFTNSALWDQVAIEGNDEISSSGWVSSYTGKPFSQQEMQEYCDNTIKKLGSYLNPNCRVLEIGCGSGLTAFTLAPFVGYYLGVDISQEILNKNRNQAKKKGLNRIDFICSPAHQIDQLDENEFDLIIINSVVHCFPGLNYLNSVLKKTIPLLKQQGRLFLGDLMDADLKEALEESMYSFKAKHANESSFRTKLDWNQELFISKKFINELLHLLPIDEIKLSKKEGTIENELTRFRFDAVISINKKRELLNPKAKNMYDLSDLESQSRENLDLNISDRNLAYILFTSGSTGIPKGVMVEHSSVRNYILWAVSYYSLDKLHFFYYSALYFDLTVTSIFAPLLSGNFLRIVNGEIDEILDQIDIATDGKILKLTPSHLSIILERKKSSESIRQFILGGETLYASHALELSNLYQSPIAIYNEYGPTEATVGCAVHKWEPSEKEGSVLIGRPISNCTIHILDKHFRPMPIGAIGEIAISGACLARGYLNHEELTTEKFVLIPDTKSRMYLTGDLGKVLPSGEIVYVGRKDRQVKIKGHRIELDEIEKKILSNSLIRACVITTKSDSNRGLYICCYYISDTMQADELSQFLFKLLPSYMIPQFFIQMASFPLTPNGKINITLLPDPDHQKKKEVVAPRSEIESHLTKIWSRVLNIPENQLSITDDFFDLGGDSIIAMRILPQIKTLGLHVSIREIFQYRTIETLSKKIIPKKLPYISQETVTGIVPLTPIQHWFWGQKFDSTSYFTMAYLFKISPNIQVEKLEEAFWKCFEYHDTLRLCYMDDRQEIKEISSLHFEISEISLSHLNESEQKIKIKELTIQIQNTIELSRPPLLKGVIFDLGNGEKRFFLAIHHLIIDGVSWRYLIEDISMLYLSSLEGTLPLKTHSFKEWALFLQSLQPLGVDEIGHWLELDMAKFPKLITLPNPLMKETSETFLYFSQEVTEVLLSKSQSFYNANINEILLAALSLSLFKAFGLDKVMISHEGHGRNETFGLDITRTLGWFTTLYPLALETNGEEITTLLLTIKNLEKFGKKDIFYGIAKYIQKNPHLAHFSPEILFNYFGRVDADLLAKDRTIFDNSTEEIGGTSYRENRLPHALEINSIVLQDCLRISIVCNPNMLGKERFDKWVNHFESQILKFNQLKVESLCQYDAPML